MNIHEVAISAAGARLNHWETWYSRCSVQCSHALVPVAVVVIQQGILGVAGSQMGKPCHAYHDNHGVGICPD